VGYFLGEIRRRLPECHALIISDYRHALLTPAFAAELVQAASHFGKPIYVDSQVSQRAANHHWYKGATLFCVNEKEALGIDSNYSGQNLPVELARLKGLLNARSIVLKRGAQGCCALLEEGYVEMPAAKVQPIDTTGAGDAFFAALSLGHAPVTAQHLTVANAWAGLSTTINGPEPPDLIQLDALLRQHNRSDAYLRN
jgi:sugar/nucleoside kinase (ribokinase family)